MNPGTILGPDGMPVVDTGSADQFEIKPVSCPYCHYKMQVSVAPWSPQFSKVKCRYDACGETYEVETRVSAYVEIEEAVVRQKDRNDHAARAPVTNNRIVTR